MTSRWALGKVLVGLRLDPFRIGDSERQIEGNETAHDFQFLHVTVTPDRFNISASRWSGDCFGETETWVTRWCSPASAWPGYRDLFNIIGADAEVLRGVTSLALDWRPPGHLRHCPKPPEQGYGYFHILPDSLIGPVTPNAAYPGRKPKEHLNLGLSTGQVN